MIRPIGLHLLLCTSLLSEVQTLKVVNFTRVYESELVNPASVGNDRQVLITVSMTSNVLSTNWTLSASSHICKINIDPFENAITSRLRVERSGDKLVVWGIRNVEVVDAVRNTIYTLLLVDTTGSCKYQAVQLPRDEVPISHPTVSPEVVAYEKSFDVFYPTLKKCAPCRFHTNNGSYIKLEKQLEMEIMRPSKSFHIQPIASNDPKSGYFYVYNYEIGTSLSKYLDVNFSVVKQKYLNHTVDVASVRLGTARSVGICRHELESVSCKRLDSSVSTVATYNVPGDSVSILFDTWGNAFIGVAKKSWGTRVWVYDSLGRYVEELDFGAVSTSAESLEVYGYFVENQYCLVVVEFENAKSLKARYVLKCFKPTEYSKAPQN